ncbi:MAG: M23 family metallopeptidase [Gemmatimonadales bacterium]|nr:MAG: M23 family metallopeptidase [Gemmatimonadales bacterium]
MAGGDAADMLPPLHGGEGASADVDADTDAPVTWPLTSRGFLTQPLLAGDAGRGRHPGIDVAVPAGSYFRAAGGGTVVEAGWDDVYGWFVRLDHGGGLETLYAHAALLVVREGERVFPGEVLGLTGSTGQSTAPHLHFELLAEGSPVDPLDRLDRP